MENYSKLINVRFNSEYSSKVYQFKTDYTDLAKGDKVVVDTVNGLAIAEVVEYAEQIQTNKNLKWIVSFIDTDHHKARLKKEKELIEIKKQLDERKSLVEKQLIDNYLAQVDPIYSQLLYNYKRLSEEI